MRRKVKFYQADRFSIEIIINGESIDDIKKTAEEISENKDLSFEKDTYIGTERYYTMSSEEELSNTE